MQKRKGMRAKRAGSQRSKNAQRRKREEEKNEPAVELTTSTACSSSMLTK
jgi:hypothetical protein